ncbi:Bacterial SH3 domain protein [Pelotomaculum schinkii]|uniref:Bacterial SH3 domain protein n=1 Tax=Pelotomaculum schinkii TaxID=78350 RepID=A0A4Y7RG38_9FIRM|nr:MULTISPECIES: hypothetical protein [Pelotomaculum]TEB07710.1 Bacterial SH3 domain protein [Pelotomaculum schinkii]TEB14067.1 Bacterial SH3 domain protein [Pelotomaculum sp. FP]
MTKFGIFKRLSLIFILAAALSLSAFLWVRNMSNTFCRMSIELYADASPDELSSPGKLEAGRKVRSLAERSPWVLVQAGTTEGWLPAWYLTRDTNDLLQDIAPYLMVVKENAPVYLYPGQDAPISDLAAGKVVKVEKELYNWRYVHIAVYDVPRVQRGWVSREYLATREEAVPMEGRLPAGTKIYYGPNAEQIAGLPEEVDPADQRVYIDKEIGEMAYVSGPGGWNAWIYKKDIVYDPF